jgi:hypothetical protein
LLEDRADNNISTTLPLRTILSLEAPSLYLRGTGAHSNDGCAGGRDTSALVELHFGQVDKQKIHLPQYLCFTSFVMIDFSFLVQSISQHSQHAPSNAVKLYRVCHHLPAAMTPQRHPTIIAKIIAICSVVRLISGLCSGLDRHVVGVAVGTPRSRTRAATKLFHLCCLSHYSASLSLE